MTFSFILILALNRMVQSFFLLLGGLESVKLQSKSLVF